MNNLIPFPGPAATGTVALPGAPFFLSCEGRCLPGLTELIIEAAAMLQRAQIEEELFKIRLRRRGFGALAQAVAGAVCQVSGLQAEAGETPALPVFPVEGSDDGRAKMTVPGFLSIPGLADPAVTPPLVSLADGPRSATRPTIDAAAPHLAPGEHDAFPNGRWAKGEWKL